MSEKDDSAPLQEISNKEKVAIIGFIAPQDAVRTSPVSFERASIEELDMYKIEEIIKKRIKMKKSKQIEKDNFDNETSVDQALKVYAEFSLYAKGRFLQSQQR